MNTDRASQFIDNLLEAVDDSLVIRKPNCEIVRSNSVAKELCDLDGTGVKHDCIPTCCKCDNHSGPENKCIVEEVCESQKAQKLEKYIPELDKYVIYRYHPVVNDNQEVEYIVEHIKDISEYRKRFFGISNNQSDLPYMRVYDNLTGLVNRLYLEGELQRLEKHKAYPVSVLTADIKGVKLVNDSYGYEVGDQLLKSAAEILYKSCPDNCTVGRWGSDEFVMVLPGFFQEEVEEWRRKIELLGDTYRIKSFPIQIATGISSRTSSEEFLEKVIARAENNMKQNKIQDEKNTRNEIINALLWTLKEKSDETEEHALRMTELSFRFGEALGLNDADIERLSLITTMHDIGKVVIAEDILKKPGSLNDFEWDRIKEHPEVGKRIVLSADSLFHIAEEISAHHEKWDGTGYPFGLSGEDIPLLARIITIIDAYDVMTNGRSYKCAVSGNEALKEIERCSGSQFDPNFVQVFVKMMRNT